MQVRVIDDPAVFLDEAGPLLLEDEARHNLILGLASTLRDHPSVYAEHHLWIVEHDSEILGAALRTPPFKVVLARPREPAALEALASAIDQELPGVVGAVPEIELFAAAWTAKTGTEPRRRMSQGVFALERVEPVPTVRGKLRPAEEDDRPRLTEWLRAFGLEALREDELDDRISSIIDHRLASANSGFVFWDDDEVVSLAGFGGPTPNGIRIGPVYTPPELRGRGYASALVAELSASLLADGRQFCFLYTDLANPTSNKIYERIGYVRVCESAEIEFVR
jgi:uncharacterized protein